MDDLPWVAKSWSIADGCTVTSTLTLVLLKVTGLSQRGIRDGEGEVPCGAEARWRRVGQSMVQASGQCGGFSQKYSWAVDMDTRLSRVRVGDADQ